MTNEEILKAAVEKAMESGFWKKEFFRSDFNGLSRLNNHTATITTWSGELERDVEIKMSYKEIIFTHKFAKAFWGESKCDCRIRVDHVEYCDKCDGFPSWRPHLQQMVLEEDPIKYLEQFLQD